MRLTKHDREAFVRAVMQDVPNTDTCNALKAKLTAAIAACFTLKQAKERLPEFVKYLPTDRDSTGTSNLPAVANLVADLVQLGWPKDKEAQA